MKLSPKLLAPLFALAAALFLIANRGAYQGYFQDDDLDNLNVSREVAPGKLAAMIAEPRYYPSNFRPVGAVFYRTLWNAAGLSFRPYIAAIHAIHLLNVVLVFVLLGRLGFTIWPAMAGALLFAFHMACFDVYWKAMYVYDLLCGALVLLSLLAYLGNRRLIGLLLMLAAFHAKEVAIALPAVLAAYEFTSGKGRWRGLIPFFALSLALGIQALIANHGQPETAYSLHIDPANLWTCIRFYAGQVFLIPFAGFLALAPMAMRDRRAAFGVLAFCALLAPMLILPGRLSAAYLYVPLTGLAAAMAAVAARHRAAWILLFFAIWIPWNFRQLRQHRNTALAGVRDRRDFVEQIGKFSREHPDVKTFLGVSPLPVNVYGARGAIQLMHPVFDQIHYQLLDTPQAVALVNTFPLAVVNWDARNHATGVLRRSADTPDVAYIRMVPLSPVWQLGEGWYEGDQGYRWIRGMAAARLNRPAGSHEFELAVNAGVELLANVKESHVTVELNGRMIGESVFSRPGIQTVRWPIPAGPPGDVEVRFHVSPVLKWSRELGIAIVGFGFP